MAIALSAIDRAFDEALLYGSASNLDGAQSQACSLPAGFGDCALLEVAVVCVDIATLLSNHVNYGPAMFIQDAAGIPQDLPVTKNWVQRHTTQIQAHLVPDQVQFWKESEQLMVLFAEVDTNASPTMDVTVYAKVRRLRPELNRTEEERGFFLTS